MNAFDEFQDITRLDEPLAPHTWLKVGGPAQIFMEPRSTEELQRVLQAVAAEELPVYVLGGGSNLLVRDEGVAGVVIKAKGEEFGRIEIDGTRIRAGGAALLSALISETAQHGLTGLEALVGIPGTVGGAIRGNAGGRHGDIGEHVRSVEALTSKGERVIRQGDELTFAYRFCSLNEPVILNAELELKPGDPEEITRQMRQVWIAKKATQPFSFQSAGCIFKNPRGLSAGNLIEQAGLKGTRVGGAEVSDRHANFIVTNEQATAADVLNLIDVIRSRVNEVHGVELELEIKVW
jgi:UDP-N-acetylmuramate dehydrogenase